MIRRKSNQSPFEIQIQKETNLCCLIWSILSDHKFELSNTGKKSLVLFLRTLKYSDVTSAMRIASRKIPNEDEIEERYRYFCGICWNCIRNTRQINEPNNKEI